MTLHGGAPVPAGIWALQVRARNFGVPGAGAGPGVGCRSQGSDTRPRVRDAGLRDAQGSGCKVPLGRARMGCLGPRVHGATYGALDTVSLGAHSAKEEWAGGSWPLWSQSLNGACVLMRRRPAATSFLFQVSVSMQAVFSPALRLRPHQLMGCGHARSTLLPSNTQEGRGTPTYPTPCASIKRSQACCSAPESASSTAARTFSSQASVPRGADLTRVKAGNLPCPGSCRRGALAKGQSKPICFFLV